MAFVLEDGTGLTNSNAYISLVEYRAYWLDRGVDEGDVDDDELRAAIVKATMYVDTAFKFRGQIKSSTQALQFPRAYLYDELGLAIEGLPTRLKNGVAEYAKRARTVDLWNVPEVDTTGLVTSKREKVGPIETEFQYQAGSVQTFKPYPQADAWLRGLILQGGVYR
jgi:hypothetical protein